MFSKNFIAFVSVELVEVDGGWSNFGDWSECSAECDGGFQPRTRLCNNPAPGNGGAYCDGVNFGIQACNTHQCPGYLLNPGV